jgi:hypothetical protein
MQRSTLSRPALAAAFLMVERREAGDQVRRSIVEYADANHLIDIDGWTVIPGLIDSRLRAIRVNLELSTG